MSRRRKEKRIAVLLMALAMAVAAFAVYIALRLPGTGPRLLSEAEDPTHTAEAFLNALCAGDYDTAAGYLPAGADLGLDSLPEGTLEPLLARAFRDSWSWSAGELWHSGAEARLPITFTALDLRKLTDGLEQEVLTILAFWLETAQRQEELYNEDNTWREAAVLQATEAALHSRLQRAEDYRSSTRLTLLLRWEEQRWVIVPDEMLYAVLSGEVSG